MKRQRLFNANMQFAHVHYNCLNADAFNVNQFVGLAVISQFNI